MTFMFYLVLTIINSIAENVHAFQAKRIHL